MAENADLELSFVERVLGGSVVLSASLLAGAHVFQALGYAPCDLCLDQREAHWTALGVSFAGLAAALVFKARRAAAAAIGAAALVYAVSAGLAFYHTGVEFKFWPGPPTCTSGGVVELGEGGLAGALEKGPSGPSCEDAPWRFLGISMAGYNFLFSAGLFALCLSAAVTANRVAVKRSPTELTAEF
ncbi:MAG: disulfide bond formation protein B [Pseudomonadota bacterium]